MLKQIAIASLISATLVGYSSVAAAYDPDEAFLASTGQFEIGNGETHTISHHKKDHTYRVCVRPSRKAVPLKVIYDGKTEIVASGNCTDFEAMDIKVTPAGKLGEDEVLLGRYTRVME